MKFSLQVIVSALVAVLVIAAPGTEERKKPARRPINLGPTQAPAPAPALPSSSEGVPAVAGVLAPEPVDLSDASEGSVADDLIAAAEGWFDSAIPGFVGPSDPMTWETFLNGFNPTHWLRQAVTKEEWKMNDFVQLLDLVGHGGARAHFTKALLKYLSETRNRSAHNSLREALESERQHFARQWHGRNGLVGRAFEKAWKGLHDVYKERLGNIIRAQRKRFEEEAHRTFNQFYAARYGAGVAGAIMAAGVHGRDEDDEEEEAPAPKRARKKQVIKTVLADIESDDEDGKEDEGDGDDSDDYKPAAK